MKILLIDQDTDTLEKLQISLTRAGYTVIIAADGEAGIRLAHKEQPDIIALDILLPGIDGVQVCEELYTSPHTTHIPRIIMTALSIPNNLQFWQPSPDQPQRVLHYDAYFPKPLEMRQFQKYVENLSKQAGSRRLVGPSILLILKDDDVRNELHASLKSQKYTVYSYDGFIKPVTQIRNHPPALLMVHEAYLSPEVWNELLAMKMQNPGQSLIVIAPSTTEAPDYIADVDHLIISDLPAWHLEVIIKKMLQHRQATERAQFLSKQILALNTELVEANQSSFAQKTELEFVNQRLRELSEMTETLTGMIVHDLKAPLSAMIGALQFITIDPGNTLSDSSRKIISGGIAASGQLQRLTLTLLDEHRLENNQLVLDIEPFDFVELLNNSLESLAPLFALHHVDVKTNIAADLPRVMADSMILQRIIENLLDNAVKYSPEYDVIIIRARKLRNALEISVSDHGEGIPPEHRELIFERFAQLESKVATASKVRSGVGLGLTFCKLAVETMGGMIWVDNEETIGTTFHFTLPTEP